MIRCEFPLRIYNSIDIVGSTVHFGSVGDSGAEYLSRSTRNAIARQRLDGETRTGDIPGERSSLSFTHEFPDEIRRGGESDARNGRDRRAKVTSQAIKNSIFTGTSRRRGRERGDPSRHE